MNFHAIPGKQLLSVSPNFIIPVVYVVRHETVRRVGGLLLR